METVLKDAVIVNKQRVLLDFRLSVYWIYCLLTDHVLSLFTITKRSQSVLNFQWTFPMEIKRKEGKEVTTRPILMHRYAFVDENRSGYKVHCSIKGGYDQGYLLYLYTMFTFSEWMLL